MRRTTVFWGLIVILIGILLLVDSLLPDVALGKLVWPLILIALGAWVLWGALTGPGSFEEQEVSVPLEGAARGRVRLRHGAGRLRLDASAGIGQLVQGTCRGAVEQRVHREGDALNVDIGVGVHGPQFALPWMWGAGGALDWRLGLNGTVPLTLDLETGASESRLDLSGLQVTELRLQTGASSTDVTMPASAGYTKGEVHSGAASVRIQVPPNVAARIQASGGLADVRIDRDRFPRQAGGYQSPDYETAANKLDLQIETGVGSVVVR